MVSRTNVAFGQVLDPRCLVCAPGPDLLRRRQPVKAGAIHRGDADDRSEMRRGEGRDAGHYRRADVMSLGPGLPPRYANARLAPSLAPRVHGRGRVLFAGRTHHFGRHDASEKELYHPSQPHRCQRKSSLCAERRKAAQCARGLSPFGRAVYRSKCLGPRRNAAEWGSLTCVGSVTTYRPANPMDGGLGEDGHSPAQGICVSTKA